MDTKKVYRKLLACTVSVCFLLGSTAAAMDVNSDSATDMIPGGIFANEALEIIADFLVGEAIDLILPNNFALTIRDDWYYANLDPVMGTVDYSHDLSAWWGYTRDPYMDHIVGDYYRGEVIERLT